MIPISKRFAIMAPQMSEEQALAILGLPATIKNKPKKEYKAEVTKQWKTMMMRHHPDRFPDPSERERNSEIAKSINNAKDAIDYYIISGPRPYVRNNPPPPDWWNRPPPRPRPTQPPPRRPEPPPRRPEPMRARSAALYQFLTKVAKPLKAYFQDLKANLNDITLEDNIDGISNSNILFSTLYRTGNSTVGAIPLDDRVLFQSLTGKTSDRIIELLEDSASFRAALNGTFRPRTCAEDLSSYRSSQEYVNHKNKAKSLEDRWEEICFGLKNCYM